MDVTSDSPLFVNNKTRRSNTLIRIQMQNVGSRGQLLKIYGSVARTRWKVQNLAVHLLPSDGKHLQPSAEWVQSFR